MQQKNKNCVFRTKYFTAGIPFLCYWTVIADPIMVWKWCVYNMRMFPQTSLFKHIACRFLNWLLSTVSSLGYIANTFKAISSAFSADLEVSFFCHFLAQEKEYKGTFCKLSLSISFRMSSRMKTKIDTNKIIKKCLDLWNRKLAESRMGATFCFQKIKLLFGWILLFRFSFSNKVLGCFPLQISLSNFYDRFRNVNRFIFIVTIPNSYVMVKWRKFAFMFTTSVAISVCITLKMNMLFSWLKASFVLYLFFKARVLCKKHCCVDDIRYF